MTLDEALERDILAVLPFGGKFLSIDDVTKRVAHGESQRSENSFMRSISGEFWI